MFLDATAPAELHARLSAQQEAVLALVTPSIDPESRGHVRGLLDGYSIALVADDQAARPAVYQLLTDAGKGGVVAIDTETAVLPEFQPPIPAAINKDGTIARI